MGQLFGGACDVGRDTVAGIALTAAYLRRDAGPPEANADPPSSLTAAHATAYLRAEHERATSTLQGAVDRLTAIVARPGFVVALTIGISAWGLLNASAGVLGFRPVDPPPFFWLQGAIATSALYVAALILTTQRREDHLASHREQLMLELSVLNDQKVSKIIELLEESRRDNPIMVDRTDQTARAMSTPSDPHSMFEAIRDILDDVSD
jgi:uncharacterized membrane protein